MAEESMMPIVLLLLACCAVSCSGSCAMVGAWYFNVGGAGEIQGLPRSPQAEPVTDAPAASSSF